jgi:nucleotide-binding universal stress UspA family protein
MIKKILLGLGGTPYTSVAIHRAKDFFLPIATYWQADMIVLGNSARNLLIKRLLGETALHIIRNADRPLFLCQ